MPEVSLTLFADPIEVPEEEIPVLQAQGLIRDPEPPEADRVAAEQDAARQRAAGERAAAEGKTPAKAAKTQEK